QIKNARAEHERLALEVLHTDSAFFMGEEYERRRLERELHGHIGPMMVSVKLDMEKNLAGEQKTIPRKELERMHRQLGEAITELRVATSRLAEGFQYQTDPVLAIGKLMDKFREYGEMKVFCRMDPLPENLDMSLRYHLFRIVEEGLTNIVKHADATKIVLRMRVSDGWLQMHLHDNGRGVGEQSIKSGPGLRLMQKRAELLSGTIRFESAKGRYFKLKLEVPLKLK
ncbi:MAG: ATP-binding protein, partial [Bacteroidales bacterium]